ncbi:hypothetical protein E2C01_066881 [Portunus trituberculatus]|uniref:Uncharacterized protein n=1 Tax=Portunus trituberculatus TaxID=210409 RepID=A0A5B7HS40_PORTR|nr:hypothetical protein [Portunus trituberculatus]
MILLPCYHKYYKHPSHRCLFKHRSTPVSHLCYLEYAYCTPSTSHTTRRPTYKPPIHTTTKPSSQPAPTTWSPDVVQHKL